MISIERLAAVAQNRNPAYLRRQIIDSANAGCSYLAIATATGLSKGVVAGIVYRARKQGLVTLEVQRAPRHTASPIVKAPPAPKLVAVEPAARSESPGIGIMSLRENTCRWPLWGNHARPDQKLFCGDATQPGRPYCPACHPRSVSAPHIAAGVDRRIDKARAAA